MDADHEAIGLRRCRLHHAGCVSSERVDLFLAAYSNADRAADGGGVEGENEHISVEEVPLSLLWTWVEQRKIEDLKSLALILALKVRRPELFG